MNDDFFKYLLPCRKKDRVDIHFQVSVNIWSAFEAYVKAQVVSVSEDNKYVGYFTQAREFQTSDTSDDMKKKGAFSNEPMRVALTVKI